MWLVPALRFPEFTEEWQGEQLHEIAELSKGIGISKEQLSENGTPCILYGELYTKYKSEIISKIISKTDIEKSKLKHSKQNDVIIPCSGETAIDIAVARCVPFDNVLLGGDLNVIRLHKYDGAFMAYQLNGKRKTDIAKLAQGVSVVHLYGENLKSIKTYNPSLQEQQKIVKLLSMLDERLEVQNKIIEALKLLRDAISGLIFNSMKNEKTILLGNVACISNGSGDVQDSDSIKRDGWYPFFDRSEEQKWFPTYSFNREAIIYAGEGQNFFPRYYKGKFALHQRCYAITDFCECLLPKYCLYFMNTLNSYFIRNAVGSTVPSLRMDMFQKAKIKIPTIERQQEIVSTLDALSLKCENEEIVRALYNTQKSYLLQQLFI